ncbi:MAG: hypothetical protein IPM64_01545 [Phycisphaerales bacterium]|nr:hypothetical protein [Phycisphaerales bacterium]
MTEALPSLRWRIAAGMLSLLMVLAAEEKARPVQGACAPACAPPLADLVGRDSEQQEEPPPLMVRATLPDGLAPRTLDRGGSASAAGASLLLHSDRFEAETASSGASDTSAIAEVADLARVSAFCRLLPSHFFDCATPALGRLHGILWRMGPPAA